MCCKKFKHTLSTKEARSAFDCVGSSEPRLVEEMGSAVTQRKTAPGDSLVKVVFNCCLIVGGKEGGKLVVELPPVFMWAPSGELEAVELGAVELELRGTAMATPTKHHKRAVSGRIIWKTSNAGWTSQMRGDQRTSRCRVEGGKNGACEASQVVIYLPADDRMEMEVSAGRNTAGRTPQNYVPSVLYPGDATVILATTAESLGYTGFSRYPDVYQVER